MTDLTERAVHRAFLRMVPFLVVCYFAAYVDRVNVGFAATTMNRDLGFSATVFGTGAGIFFIGYFLFEVPSNLAVARFGARRWIARIMLTWGLLAGAMALARNVPSFYALRFLLGSAEAGFFPGVLFFLTLWFPAAHRGRIVAWFMAAIPVSTIVGAPVSGLLLGLDGAWGLHGWQWLYLLEAVPSLVLCGFVPFVLCDRPADAAWLPREERDALAATLAREARAMGPDASPGVWRTLRDVRVLTLSLVYFGAIACTFGVGFWLPQMVKGFGLGDVQAGFVTAIPYVAGLVAMIAWGRHSDRTGERRWHVALALVVAACGLVLSTWVPGAAAKLAALSVAACGILAAQPVFWALPPSFLQGRDAAAGLALVNALGGLAGFAGPFAVGAIKDWTGGFSAGLVALAACALVAAGAVLTLHAAPRTVPLPAE